MLEALAQMPDAAKGNVYLMRIASECLCTLPACASSAQITVRESSKIVLHMMMDSAAIEDSFKASISGLPCSHLP
jgi:hypothetical protein